LQVPGGDARTPIAQRLGDAPPDSARASGDEGDPFLDPLELHDRPIIGKRFQRTRTAMAAA
jgi:hypothetical protein